MEFANKLPWTYAVLGAALIAPLPGPGHIGNTLSQVYRSPLVYASHLAEIAEGLIDHGFDVEQSIGVAAMAACTAPVDAAGYALQLDKKPFDNGCYSIAYDVLGRSWKHRKPLAKWRSQQNEQWLPPSELDDISVNEEYMPEATSPLATVPTERIPEGSAYVDGHLVIDLNDAAMTLLLLRSSYWIQKKVIVSAEQSVRSKTVRTVLKNGKSETLNTAEKGDWIITNPGGEQYVLKPEQFTKRYHATGKKRKNLYKSVGDGVYVPNPYGVPVCVPSPLNPAEYMFGAADCGFVAAFDTTKTGKRDTVMTTADRYIIGREEKLKTYRPFKYYRASLMTYDTDLQAVLPNVVGRANKIAYDPYADDLIATTFGRRPIGRSILTKLLG